MLVFVSYRRSERREEEIKGSLLPPHPTHGTSTFISQSLPKDALDTLSCPQTPTAKSKELKKEKQKANRWLRQVDRFLSKNTAGEGEGCMGAKPPSKTLRISSICRCRLPPLPPSVSSSSSSSYYSSTLLSFSLVLSHGSDIEAVAWSAAPPLPRLAVETGASR